MNRLGLLTMIAATGFGIAALTPAFPQSYPSRPVKIVVPIAAGGPVDLVTRAVADSLSVSLKQPFVIENRPGAGGNVGIQAAIGVEPDGYTLLTALGTMLTINPALYSKPPFDPETDLRPLSILTTSSQMLVINPSVPANSLEEFVAMAKDHPVTYGISGYGTPSHLAMEYLRLRAEFQANPIPYRGNVALVTDLMAGQIEAGFVATAGVIQHVRDGRLRALAVSTLKRSRLAPDVRSVAEAGYPGYSFDSFIIMLAPAGTPEPVAALLEREVRRAAESPEFRRQFLVQDIETVASTGAAAKSWIKTETKRWADIIKAANMRIN